MHCQHCGCAFESPAPLQIPEVVRTLNEASAHHLEEHDDEIVAVILEETANNLLADRDTDLFLEEEDDVI